MMKMDKICKRKKLLTAVVVGLNMAVTIVPALAASQNITLPDDSISSTVHNFVHGDSMTINDGGDGIIENMEGGTQIINNGGKGTITTMKLANQIINVGGNGIITTMFGGKQTVNDGGVGTINTMSGGEQCINYVSGGTPSTGNATGNILGTNKAMQHIGAGTGTINENAGRQRLHYGNSIGNITINTGSQEIWNGTGTIETMNGGQQIIGNKDRSDEEQTIAGKAIGNITTMNKGAQTIEKSSIGFIDTMNLVKQVEGDDAVQSVNDGQGTINTIKNGRQVVEAKGIGKIGIIQTGAQDIRGGQGTISTMEGGKQEISAGGTGTIITMSGGGQYIDNSTGIIKTMTAGDQHVKNGGTATIGSMSFGRQFVEAGGTATINTMTGGEIYVFDGGYSKDTSVQDGLIYICEGGAKVSNLSLTNATLYINATGHQNYTLSDNFIFNNGVVDMTTQTVFNEDHTPKGTKFSNTYETLTIDNFIQGGGTFIMNTDLASQTDGDKIVIKNAGPDAGTSYIQVKDVSNKNYNPNGKESVVPVNRKLLLVTVENGTANFEGKGINDGGIWTVTPVIGRGDQTYDEWGNAIGNAKEWYLACFAKTVNEDTEVLLHRADNTYALWRNTNDTLRKRLGELHLRKNVVDGGGIWARYIGGKFDGMDYDGNYNVYQLGYDKANNAKSTYGFAFEKGAGHATYDQGNGKDKVFSGMVYDTWTGDSGCYTDVVAKIGQFDSESSSYGEYPDKAKYKTRAYSLSVEYGKTITLSENAGTFFEPQAQFIMGRLDGTDYISDRKNHVYLGGVNSYIGRLGFVLGKKAANQDDLYLKASVLHEFGGDRTVHMEAANGDTLSISKDYGDTWVEVGVGTNIRLGKSTYFYGDFERSFGADIEKKWQINAGVRYSF